MASLCLSSGSSLILGCPNTLDLDLTHSWNIDGVRLDADVAHSWALNGSLEFDISNSWAINASLFAVHDRVFYIPR